MTYQPIVEHGIKLPFRGCDDGAEVPLVVKAHLNLRRCTERWAVDDAYAVSGDAGCTVIGDGGIGGGIG